METWNFESPTSHSLLFLQTFSDAEFPVCNLSTASFCHVSGFKPSGSQIRSRAEAVFIKSTVNSFLRCFQSNSLIGKRTDIQLCFLPQGNLPERAFTYKAVIERIKVPSSFAVQLHTFSDLYCYLQQCFHAYRLRQKALTKLVNQLLPTEVFVPYGAASFSSSSPGPASSINVGLQRAICARGIPLYGAVSPSLTSHQDPANKLSRPCYWYIDSAGYPGRHCPSWKVSACRYSGRTMQGHVNAAQNIVSVFFTLVFSGGTRRGTLFES
ncbi:hypothetical protein BDK51DRAFT_37289 [Blyttiomyces helicus]|uniref:Uncharacterized protein n=1 Tax=Blyttiomyces helicus TaxID=388810 RepID=A0A4P9WRC8_9FUNG|nr:hypothetical protein BDK51DRAFT_37289 [Blyttiomyces helicus]|eukprot:RKO93456.1 hypothetical protein BDK51DRAFT_37289 [Blyttiomyces helicus]